jgi:hypothetical protein
MKITSISRLLDGWKEGMIGNEAIASFILCRPRKLGMTAETISFADQAVIDEIQSPKCSSFAALNTQVASFLTVMIEILLEKLGIKSCGLTRDHLLSTPTRPQHLLRHARQAYSIVSESLSIL